MIAENYNRIKKNILDSQNKSNLGNEVCLLAVSKTRSVEEIMQLYNLGVRDFGENQVQELVRKYEELPKDIRWHMIGHLQRNKVKYIAPFIYCIHSVESIRLADMIDKEAKKNNRSIDVLIEVNIAIEDSKFGLNESEIEEFMMDMESYKNLIIKGFMTVAPNNDISEKNRDFFVNMYKIYIDNSQKKRDNIDINVLSMGMSKDYNIAIEEGATIVRIGTDLFGNRFYK